MAEYLITSESVTEGHPDKICDEISDGILDEFLYHDKDARVALETMVSANTVMIAGEVTSIANLDITAIARKIIKEIGYTSKKMGFDYKNCLILTNINKQSTDIALGVDKKNQTMSLGAGDQGIMYGYACSETKNYMPLPIELASKIVKKLAEMRKKELIPWLYPDGKAQITVKYNEKNEPLYITSIVVSAQHDENIGYEYLCSVIKEEVIYETIDDKWLNYDTKIHINPTGRFVIGGPLGDTGVTGRKIMVDTYGGIAKHGGGAFSGKDPTKVDRSAAYMCRYVAKNIVAAGLCKRCEVSLAYAIGLEEPEAININTFGTEKVEVDLINTIVKEVFSFSPKDIIDQLNLRKPQFLKTAVYGHFGREDEGFAWEKLDKVNLLQEKVKDYLIKSFSCIKSLL